MTTPSTSVEMQVPSEQDVVSFVHRLGCPVVVTAYDTAGAKVGYVSAIDITDDEVEVILAPGVDYDRLVADPAPEDEDEPAAGDD